MTVSHVAVDLDAEIAMTMVALCCVADALVALERATAELGRGAQQDVAHYLVTFATDYASLASDSLVARARTLRARRDVPCR